MGGIDRDALGAVRAAHAGKLVDTAKGLSKQEIREQTFSADARKARDLVKMMATHSLPELAAAMLPVILERSLRDRLGAALEELAEANAEYRRVEMLPPGMVEWMGGYTLSNGLLPQMPEFAPEHKKRFGKAWNTLLITVNEITKVGVTKRSRGTPIVLQVDVDLTEATKVQVQGYSGDGW